MKHGDQQRIAEETKLSKGFVSAYFRGVKDASEETIQKIQKAMDKLGIEYTPENEESEMEENTLKVRWDIHNNLPHGAIAQIAREVECSPSHVQNVLNGVSKDNFGIIKIAELEAAVNIWKTRFCKYKSEL
jgi:predicted transcriptional regulator